MWTPHLRFPFNWVGGSRQPSICLDSLLGIRMSSQGWQSLARRSQLIQQKTRAKHRSVCRKCWKQIIESCIPVVNANMSWGRKRRTSGRRVLQWWLLLCHNLHSSGSVISWFYQAANNGISKQLKYYCCIILLLDRFMEKTNPHFCVTLYSFQACHSPVVNLCPVVKYWSSFLYQHQRPQTAPFKRLMHI